MRGATLRIVTRGVCMTFQSTLLMRGATISTRPLSRTPYFNPRSSCEERRRCPLVTSLCASFQSTLLMRGATEIRRFLGMSTEISIHAPHARSDRLRRRKRPLRKHFNPRSSCEERQKQTLDGACTKVFQSTLLMRGATDYLASFFFLYEISIHAPHARSDVQ